MIAAIYARKSTEQHASTEDRSVARQIANARRFAASKGWTIADAHVYSDDGISGAEVKRLIGKQSLLDVIHSGRAPFSIVIVQHRDRWSRRDGIESQAELIAVARRKIEVWYYADGR